MTLIQLKQKDLKPLREKWYNEQDGICPILNIEIPFEQTVIDHQHKLKKELADEMGKGVCRGCIERSANALEGKITNNFKRMGLSKYIDLPTFLRNLADYLEHNKIKDEVKYIHPNEAPPRKKLMKSSYNKLIKAMPTKQKTPKYTGNYSKKLQTLFEKYEITPNFY